jgi:hypothetical protein
MGYDSAVGSNQLGRVLDPSALDACTGARARLAVGVPAAWLAEGGELELTAPLRLPCAGCDGGGCDACARSGVLRAAADVPARTLRTRIPGGSAGAVAIRIPRPFGAGCAIEQLLLELRPAERPSACIRRIAAPRIPTFAPAPVEAIPWPAVGAALVAAASILLALLSR